MDDGPQLRCLLRSINLSLGIYEVVSKQFTLHERIRVVVMRLVGTTHGPSAPSLYAGVGSHSLVELANIGSEVARRRPKRMGQVREWCVTRDKAEWITRGRPETGP